MRFVGSPGINLERFLKRQPPWLLKRIREVEYLFFEVELIDGFLGISTDPELVNFRSEWMDLVNFIKNNLNLPKLTISLDGSPSYMDWVTHNMTSEGLESWSLPRAYDCVTNR